jgi:endoplasmic reticulum-Golgi intermediate compartment protein 2
MSELRSWFRGTENHQFTVEKGISHQLQLNLDIVIPMQCDDLRVNVQDAAGDRILAGELLRKESTSWQAWMAKVNREISSGVHEYQTLNQEDTKRIMAQEADAHARHVLSEVRRNARRKFPRGPSLRRGDRLDSCRIYGSLEGNKVIGDFHITARGHGYQEFGAHLDHKCMSLASFFFAAPRITCTS